MKFLNWKNNFLALASLLIFMASCNQNPYLATHLAPSTDGLNAASIDSFQIYAQPAYHNNVVANNLNTYLLGAINNNPIFGSNAATIYAQFNLPENQFSFDATAVIDSAFFCLPYVGTYGDTLSKMNVTATEVDAASPNYINNESNDSAYLSSQSFTLKGPPIGALTNIPLKIKDSIKVYGATEVLQLRIPIIDAAFLQNIKTQSASGAYLNAASFHKFFNGVYIDVTTSATTNALMQLAANNPSVSGMRIYYHTATADSLSVLFGINANGTINHFSHNFIGSKAANAIANTTGNDTVLYVSGAAGVRGKLYIPSLSKLKNVGINKATLTFYDVNPSYTGLFGTPNNLFLTRYDATTKLGYSLEDYSEGSPLYGVSTATYYGGARGTDGSYTFNIGRYLQKLINGTHTNDGFYLEMFNAAQRPYQVVLGGGNNSKYKIKLKIIYTKIK